MRWQLSHQRDMRCYSDGIALVENHLTDSEKSIQGIPRLELQCIRGLNDTSWVPKDSWHIFGEGIKGKTVSSARLKRDLLKPEVRTEGDECWCKHAAFQIDEPRSIGYEMIACVTDPHTNDLPTVDDDGTPGMVCCT